MIPDRIFIGPGAEKHALAQKILSAFKEVERIKIKNPQNLPIPNDKKRGFVFAKRSLLLCIHKGPLIRKLTRPYGLEKPEYYLYHATGCPFDCQYCFLQDWLGSPVPTIHVNDEDLLEQIANQVVQEGENIYLHAGEMADSLVWDIQTEHSKILAKACSRWPKLTCELRTKSDTVKKLLTTAPPKNMVVSWTLSPKTAIVKYEPRTPAYQNRIDAMVKVAKAGFNIGLRLDPLICEGDFVEDYENLLRGLAKDLPVIPESISAGSLRMTKQCLNLAKSRFPKSRLFAGELLPGLDQKIRYSRPLRKKAYKIIGDTAKELWGLDLSYCMEPE